MPPDRNGKKSAPETTLDSFFLRRTPIPPLSIQEATAIKSAAPTGEEVPASGDNGDAHDHQASALNDPPPTHPNGIPTTAADATLRATPESLQEHLAATYSEFDMETPSLPPSQSPSQSTLHSLASLSLQGKIILPHHVQRRALPA